MNGKRAAPSCRASTRSSGRSIFLVIGGEAWTLRGLAPHLPARAADRGAAALLAGRRRRCRCSRRSSTSALEIAAPVLIALLITDVAFGVVSRVVPQLNVFAVGFPTKVAVALLVVGASLPFVGQLDLQPARRSSVGAALGALHVGVRPMAQRRPHREGHTQAPQAGAQEGPGRAQRRTSAARWCWSPGLLAHEPDRARRSSTAVGAAFRGDLRARSPTPAQPPRAAGLNGLMHIALSTLVLAVAPIAARLPARAAARRRAPRSASARTPQALKPDFRRINPVSGLRNLLGPNTALRSRQGGREGRRRRRRRRDGDPAGAHGARRRTSASRPVALGAMLGQQRARDRPARRLRLPADRRRSTTPGSAGATSSSCG